MLVNLGFRCWVWLSVLAINQLVRKSYYVVTTVTNCEWSVSCVPLRACFNLWEITDVVNIYTCLSYISKHSKESEDKGVLQWNTAQLCLCGSQELTDTHLLENVVKTPKVLVKFKLGYELYTENTQPLAIKPGNCRLTHTSTGGQRTRTDRSVLWLAECVKRVYLGRVIREFLRFSRGLERHSQAFCSATDKAPVNVFHRFKEESWLGGYGEKNVSLSVTDGRLIISIALWVLQSWDKSMFALTHRQSFVRLIRHNNEGQAGDTHLMHSDQSHDSWTENVNDDVSRHNEPIRMTLPLLENTKPKSLVCVHQTVCLYRSK